MKDGLYYRGDVVVLPADPELINKVLAECHDTPYCGHVGRTKTLHNVQRYFWWPNMQKDVQQFVASCDSCQRVKSLNYKPSGQMQPLPIPADTWESVSMDLIVSLPRTSSRIHGYCCLCRQAFQDGQAGPLS